MKKKLCLWLVLVLGLMACSTAEPTPQPPVVGETTVPEVATETADMEPVTLRLMTHDSFEITSEVIDQFSAQTGHQVEIFKAGDAGEMVNKAILAKDAPLADVLFGVDNTFLSRALENDIFLPYESPLTTYLAPSLLLDEQYRAVPVDFGDVCLNYDKGWFAENGVTPPTTLEELSDPIYKDLLVVTNPATSSPGLSFVLATIAAYGEDGYLAYWQRLVDNGVLVVNGWTEAYYGEFTAASDGTRPIVLSYASSPPAEVLFAETELTEAPTAVITASCFRQIEFVGILRGTPHEAAAQQLVDYMLDIPFQEDIPLNMFVYPASEAAVLPPVFEAFSVLPEEPLTLDSAVIAENREAWLSEWTAAVLR